MEYMNHGSLLSYLREKGNATTETDLFDMAKQICDGMEYLESKKVIHK